MKEEIAIIPYTGKYAKAIKELNYEWILHYFKLEPGDIKSLNNPEKEILDKSGYIFYAIVNENAVGVVTLLKISDTVYELSKMAVSSAYQGKGIGKRLIVHALHFSKEKGFEKLVLYSNTKLVSAIHLYKNFGFYEVELETGLYERANIKMEKLLSFI
ncbi:hypothetical protein NBRC110019_10500 [Neptunitalea chrysea]|uniref:N-acetyltransferase domain-containing protein n=1 Tax=Neptunitalea chrysea TaxID=1647581 RepID=A0A9W6EUQ3_9FLAO|nr:GNAT family N-acetyltransferase [Neptunitalea chrysea]GLB52011.1 hypothetical protein NBRC110019_10500 [Neptunitalea chrysea]